ncbi:MAG: hypothetical protein ACOC1J_00850 [Prolixibacteraceae bacterium]
MILRLASVWQLTELPTLNKKPEVAICDLKNKLKNEKVQAAKRQVYNNVSREGAENSPL